MLCFVSIVIYLVERGMGEVLESPFVLEYNAKGASALDMQYPTITICTNQVTQRTLDSFAVEICLQGVRNEMCHLFSSIAPELMG